MYGLGSTAYVAAPLDASGFFQTPVTPGPHTIMPESAAWGEGWWAGQTTGIAPSPAEGLTPWLNANASKIAIGAAAFLALVFVAKAGR